MFVINEDLSIYCTRGDYCEFPVKHQFKQGDVVRFKATRKKDCETVVIQRDFVVEAETDEITISLTGEDTKIGEVISKPTDYWYEVELNPDTHPQTIIGYDDDGAKVFKLFPEGKDVDAEDIEVVGKKTLQELVDYALEQARDSGEFDGEKGDKGDKGDTGNSGVYVGETEPTDPDVSVWVNPNGEEIDLSKTEDCVFSLTEVPLYGDYSKEKAQGWFPVIEVLDVYNFALANKYAGNAFSMINPMTLEATDIPAFDMGTGVTNPQWVCAKILPANTNKYDYVLAWSQLKRQIYRFSTTGVLSKANTDLKLGWLRNTGIDIAYNNYCNAQGSTIMFAEYCLPTYVDESNPPTTINVWRSTDLGDTWTSVFTQETNYSDNPEILHFHCVRHDPYNPGHWYLTSGDQPSESNIWRSTDDGLTWTKINDASYSGGLQSIHRTCNLVFTEDYIYWGTDDSVTALGTGNGGKWVRSPRNLESNELDIEVLVQDLGSWVRITMPTPYGVLITTEKRFNDNSFVWLAPYDDLEHPVLLATPKDEYIYNTSDYSFGSRIFIRDADTDREHKLYPYWKTNEPRAKIWELNKVMFPKTKSDV